MYGAVDVCWRSGYAAPRRAGGEGAQEAGASPARSRHCNRGANLIKRATAAASSRAGRPEASVDPGARRLDLRPQRSGRGEDPEREVLVERDFRRISLGEVPLWSWLLTLLLLGLLFT